MRSRPKRIRRFMAAALCCGAASVWAVDGVVLVDHNKALTGGVTPGDTPGYPISITQSGSYRLTGNLVVPDANTDAIVVSANHVTIDLNGFSIVGPADCSAGFPCTNTATSSLHGHGVLAGSDSPVKPIYGVTVRNGTITGMGADGVHLLGDSLRIEDLRIRSNGLSGILARAAGGAASSTTNVIIRGNNLQRNGSYGMKTDAAMITDNVVTECRDIGIRIDLGPGLVARNIVSSCGLAGMQLNTNVPYMGNSMLGNGTPAGTLDVIGGVDAGHNLCSGGSCP